MDFTILYVILACVGVVGLIILITWLLKKINVDVDDVVIILDPTETIIQFAKVVLIDMGISEKEVTFYTDVCIDTLEYLKVIPEDVGKETRISEGIEYARETLEAFDIELTPSRIQIIEILIPALWNLYYAVKATQTKVEIEK